jgi:mono/diheme cytochrome c family protein
MNQQHIHQRKKTSNISRRDDLRLGVGVAFTKRGGRPTIVEDSAPTQPPSGVAVAIIYRPNSRAASILTKILEVWKDDDRAATLRKLVLVAGLLCCLAWSSLASAEDTASEKPSPEQREFFEKQVRPLLVKRCFECHGATKAGGGLSLQTAQGWRNGGDSGPAIIPGKPDDSLLIDAINYRSLEMPPADKGGKLSEEEIALLTNWVAMGAPDPRDGRDILGGMTREEAQQWWAFQPLPDAPAADTAADVRRIDEFVQREIDGHGLITADGSSNIAAAPFL